MRLRVGSILGLVLGLAPLLVAAAIILRVPTTSPRSQPGAPSLTLDRTELRLAPGESGSVSLTATDDTPQALVFSVTSDDSALLPPASLTLVASAPTATLTVTLPAGIGEPPPGQDRLLTVRVQVADATEIATATLLVRQRDPRPDPPTLAGLDRLPLNAFTHLDGVAPQGFNEPTTVAITGGDLALDPPGPAETLPEGAGRTTATLAPGQRLALRQRAAATPDTVTTAILTFGSGPGAVSAPWTVRTSPDLTVPGLADAPANQRVTSNELAPGFPIAATLALQPGPGAPQAQVAPPGGSFGPPFGPGETRPLPIGGRVRFLADVGPADGTSRTIRASLGGVTASWVLTGQDLDPDAFTFGTSAGHPPGESAYSAPVTISGITGQAPVSIDPARGEVSIDGGPFTVTGFVGPRGTLQARLMMPEGTATPQTLSVLVGGRAGFWTAQPAGSDTLPDDWAGVTFAPIAGAEPDVIVTTPTVTLTQFNAPVSLILGGTGSPLVSLEGGPFVPSPLSAPLALRPNQPFRIQARTALHGLSVAPTVTIAGLTKSWSVDTRALDTTPAAFTFTDVSGQPGETQVTHAPITLAGFLDPAPVALSGTCPVREVSIAGGPFTATPGPLAPGQSLTARCTTGLADDTTYTMTVTVGGVGDSWSVDTPDWYPDQTGWPADTDYSYAGRVASTDLQITGIANGTPWRTVSGFPDQAWIAPTQGGLGSASLQTSGTINNNDWIRLYGPGTGPGQTRQFEVLIGSRVLRFTITPNGESVPTHLTTPPGRAGLTAGQAVALPFVATNVLGPVRVMATGYGNPQVKAGTDCDTATNYGTFTSLATSFLEIAPDDGRNVAYCVRAVVPATPTSGTVTTSAGASAWGRSGSVTLTQAVRDSNPDVFSFPTKTVALPVTPDSYEYVELTPTGYNAAGRATATTIGGPSGACLVYGFVGPLGTDVLYAPPNRLQVYYYHRSPIPYGETHICRITLWDPGTTLSHTADDVLLRTVDWTVVFPAGDGAPDAVSFGAPLTGQAPAAEILSPIVIPVGYTRDTVIAIADNGHGTAQYRVAGGAWTAAPGRIAPGQSVQLRLTSGGPAGETRRATLSLNGTAQTSWSVATADSLPDPLTFSARTQASPDQWLVSEQRSVGGLGQPVPFTVTALNGAEAQLEVSGARLTSGTVMNGQSVQLWVKPRGFQTTNDVTLSLGGLTAVWQVATRAQSTTPAGFAIPPATGSAGDRLVESATVRPAGFLDPAPFVLTDRGPGLAEAKIGDAAWGVPAAGATIAPGQALRLRLRTGSADGSARTATVSVGGVPATWTVTTADLTPVAPSLAEGVGATGAIVTTQRLTPTGFDAPLPIAVTAPWPGADARVTLFDAAGTQIGSGAGGTLGVGQSVTVSVTVPFAPGIVTLTLGETSVTWAVRPL